MLGEGEDGVDDGFDFCQLKLRGARSGEVQEVGQQAVEALAFLLNDFQKLDAAFFAGRLAQQDGCGALDAGERVADFVGQSGRELAEGVEALGTFHALKVLLQFSVHLADLAGGLAERVLLAALAIGERAGEDGDGGEGEELGELIDGVFGQDAPGGEDLGQEGESGEEGGQEASGEAVAEGGVDDGQVEEALDEVVPLDE